MVKDIYMWNRQLLLGQPNTIKRILFFKTNYAVYFWLFLRTYDDKKNKKFVTRGFTNFSQISWGSDLNSSHWNWNSKLVKLECLMMTHVHPIDSKHKIYLKSKKVILTYNFLWFNLFFFVSIDHSVWKIKSAFP